ncbi:radical SAM protein, partial [Patescibacteria group bacterium]|nr:radical SAM protein [Patescibacteria group bacterium]
SYQAPDAENFSAHNPFKNHFAALLWEVNQVPGIKRLHFTAPHPREFDDEVIEAMALPAHLNFLHLPVQSGDNEVLRRMNRKHTVEDFEDAIRRVREKIPNIALGTDLIVGFCGETPEQFEKTVKLFQRVKFDMSYHAMYSQRSGTAAAKAFKDDVSPEEKRRRWDVIQELLIKTVLELNQKYVGQSVSVLVERCEEAIHHEKAEKMCYGFSRELKLSRFPGDESLVGKIVDVKINKADKWLLEGEYVQTA